MLEKYEYLIYHSEEEKVNAQKEYHDYFDQVWNENKQLFDLTAEKYGKPLWNGLAWKDVDCKRKCPFGDGCENDRIIIDDKEFCLGQIYYYGYSLNDILDMIMQSKSAYLTDHSEYKCEISCDYGADHLSDFYKKINDYFYCFADEYKDNKRVYGDNVISLLKQDNSR